MNRLVCIATSVVAACFFVTVPASAQLNSNEATATLTAVLAESLSVSLLPSATSFTLTSGSATNAGLVPISATTTWTLALTRTNVKLYGYFSDASDALRHTLLTNTVNIPSDRVEVSVNGATAVPFDQAVVFSSNAGRQLFSQDITVLNASGSRTDALALNINLASYVLPADAYVGTLRIRAQATP
jgi:hypothetical protein